jgi:hypothetical protein
MAGAIAIVVVLLLLPVLVLIAGGIGSAVLGEVLWRDGQARAEGNELRDLPD